MTPISAIKQKKKRSGKKKGEISNDENISVEKLNIIKIYGKPKENGMKFVSRHCAVNIREIGGEFVSSGQLTEEDDEFY